MEIKVNNTFFTGKFLVHLPSVDSTNNYAKEYIAKSSPINGTVILADEQFAGRGQIGNTWLSEPNKNLTFSIIYQTSFLLATEQFYLNMAISLGIWSFINSQLPSDKKQPTVSIKWPNDIYVNDRKISGILIENTISGMHLKYSVIGIGLNVNQLDFAERLKATSLKIVTQKEADRERVLEQLLISIEKYFFLLKERKFEKLRQEYTEQLFRFMETARYERDGNAFEGKITGVDASGKLIMETAPGIQKFSFKEISYLTE